MQPILSQGHPSQGNPSQGHTPEVSPHPTHSAAVPVSDPAAPRQKAGGRQTQRADRVRAKFEANEFVATSQAARLLDRDCDTLGKLKARLAVGLGGLAALGCLPASLARLAGGPAEPSSEIAASLLPIASLPLTAVLTLVLPLPGLLILLSMQQAAPGVGDSLHALSRAIYRQGLLALGLVPILSLFALTGASPVAIASATTLGYFLAGAAALWCLLFELWQALCLRTARSGLLLLGWGAFVALLSTSVFSKLGGL